MSQQILESQLWAQIRASLSSADTHVSRIENTVGTGISDVSACHGGVEVWLELKVFHGQRLHFRASQRIWITNRTHVGGRVFVVARMDNVLMIFDGKAVVDTPNYKIETSKAFSILLQDLPTPLYSCKKPFDWTKIKQALFCKVT